MPAMSFVYPYALMRLPYVREPLMATGEELCNCFNCDSNKSGLPMRTQASTTEESVTSSIGSSMFLIKAIVFTMSACPEWYPKPFSKMEIVTWFGFTSADCISSTMSHISLRWPPCPLLTTALMNSLKVTRCLDDVPYFLTLAAMSLVHHSIDELIEGHSMPRRCPIFPYAGRHVPCSPQH